MLFALALPLGAKWIRLASGPFDLYTDGGEQAARETLERLDLARRVFSGLAPSLRATPLPVRVFLLSEGRFRGMRPGETIRGFYQGAAERDSIVLPASGSTRVVFHEYVHLVLHHTSGPLPKWMEEGLAEFHSTLEVRNGKVRLGGVVAGHLRLLATSSLLSAAELTAPAPQSSHAGLFYAQSWAMVHMLRLHERYRQAFPSFLAAIEQGEPQPAAFQRLYGKTASEAVSDLKSYIERTMLPVVEIPVALDTASAVPRRIELEELDGDTAYAELARECGRPKEAEKIYARLARNRPSTALGESALGYIALGRDHRDQARRHFEKALELGSRDAAVAFEYAMLTRDSGAPRAEVRRLIERVVDWNADFAEAQFLLGVEDAHEGRHAAACARFRQALSVLPRQSYFWHALSLSEAALGNRPQAELAANRALDSAADANQAQMARAALDRAAGPRNAPPPAAAPAVIVPESWRPRQGEERLEGVLERIDCQGRSARFHVRAAGGVPKALWVENPGEVLMKNLSSVTFEFRCGTQKPVPVMVEYLRKADAATGTVGVITAIEFR